MAYHFSNSSELLFTKVTGRILFNLSLGRGNDCHLMEDIYIPYIGSVALWYDYALGINPG